jgi:hypothetical protein
MSRYSIYFWFKEAPRDRPGGPWWREDFEDIRRAEAFFRVVWPFAYALRLVDRRQPLGHGPLVVRNSSEVPFGAVLADDLRT